MLICYEYTHYDLFMNKVVKFRNKKLINLTNTAATVKNQTNFGYKEQLKTTILKKIHFVFLETFSDLVGFIWAHLQEENSMMGMLVIENIQEYFGDGFQYAECGDNFLILMMMLRQFRNKLQAKGRVCYTYAYNPKIFPIEQYSSYLSKLDITNLHIDETHITKNNLNYETTFTRQFYQIYIEAQQ